MKKVIFVRHGKSSWSNPYLEDRQRPLKARGRRDASLIAGVLADANRIPQKICSSHALRASQTADIFQDILSVPEMELFPQLYHADESEIIQFLGRQSNEKDFLMLFGHNPGYTDLINLYSDDYFVNVPTSGAFEIEYEISSWDEISDYNGALRNYWFPGMFR